MTKREHGAGSWKKRANGTLELQLSFGRDLEGRLIRKSFYGKTKKICQAKADEYKLQLQNNEIIAKEIPLGKWLEKWLETYKSNSVSEGTYANYLDISKIIRKHKISSMKMSDIRSIHITDFINDNQEYGLSVLKKLKFLLSGSFEDAIDNDLCHHNPARKVKLPQKSKIEREYFNENELKLIYEFSKTDPFGYVIQTLLQTGIRSGELRALTWKDFDLEHKLLTIDKAVKANGEIGMPKNGHIRVLPIKDKLYRQLISIEKTGKYFLTDSDENSTRWVFRHQYDSFFDRLKEKHPDVRYLSAHCCRHTFASDLHTKGVQLKYIQMLLGHSDIQTTGNIYTHVDVEEIRKVIDLI